MFLKCLVLHELETEQLIEEVRNHSWFYLAPCCVEEYLVWQGLDMNYTKSDTLGAVENGDNSVAARWTVDQKVVGSNPTHDGNCIAVVRSLSEFTQPIR